MALKDTIALGMSLPHRSPDPIDRAVVSQVAQRAESLGFGDLWVTDNTIDEAGCFEKLEVLHHPDAGHRETFHQCAQRLPVLAVQIVEQLAPCRIGEGFEHDVHTIMIGN